MRGNRVHDVPQGEHRIGNRHGDTRESDDPHDHAHAVAEDATEQMRLDRHAAEFTDPVLAGQSDDPKDVGAGLEQELRPRVEQNADDEEGEGRPGHHRLLTTTRRASRPSSTIGTPSRRSFSYWSGCIIAYA